MKQILLLFSVSFLLAPNIVLANESNSVSIQNRVSETQRERFNAAKETAIEKMERRREEFQAKLQTIQDERKQRVVQNLSVRFANINDRWTTHWGVVLDRLEGILAKVESRTQKISEKGRDVSATNAAVANARSQIAKARTAVLNQADKEYVFEIDTEENLGTSVSSKIEEFHSDLRQTREYVEDARESVGVVLRSFRAAGGADEE